MVGLAIAALVLLLTFGTLVAAGLPLATALFGLGISSAIGGRAGRRDRHARLVDVRGRDDRDRRRHRLRAADHHALPRRAGRRRRTRARRPARRSSTAGRSVLVAGGTVVISLMGLFLTGLPYMYGVALAAIASVLVVMAASVTLLPALLGFARERINKLRIPGAGRVHGGSRRGRSRRALEPRRAAAAAGRRGRRHGRAAGAGRAGAGHAAGLPGRRQRPRRHDHPPGLRPDGDRASAPDRPGRCSWWPTSTRPATASRSPRCGKSLADEPGVASVAPPVFSPAGDTAVLNVVPTTAPQDERDRGPDPHTCATTCCRAAGWTSTSAARPRRSSTRARRPPASCRSSSAAVVGLSFLLLLAAFRAPVVALKAGVMNLLSIARGVRRRGARRRRRVRRQPGRDRRGDPGAAVPAGDHVRDPVRALDGLRGVPALARSARSSWPGATPAVR